MARRQRVRASLNSGDIRELPQEEIRVILRVADELIATGAGACL